jgi:8-oxo-dGTP diphosphatase
VTVDLVAFGFSRHKLRALFIKRKRPPFQGRWAIPGGFLEMDEPIEAAARRELFEETGLEIDGAVEPIGTFAGVDRDPRGRTISIAHAGVVKSPIPHVAGGDDAADAAWLEPNRSIELAFDHRLIVDTAITWLARRLKTTETALILMPEEFSEDDLTALYEQAGLPRRSAAACIKRTLEMNVIGRTEKEGRFRKSGEF